MPTGLDILEYLSSNQLQSSFPFTWLQEIEPADVGALNLYVRLIADGLEADNLTVDISNLTAQESIEKALAMNQPSLQEGVDYIFVLEAVNKQETQTELVDVVVYDDGYTYLASDPEQNDGTAIVYGLGAEVVRPQIDVSQMDLTKFKWDGFNVDQWELTIWLNYAISADTRLQIENSQSTTEIMVLLEDLVEDVHYTLKLGATDFGEDERPAPGGWGDL